MKHRRQRRERWEKLETVKRRFFHHVKVGPIPRGFIRPCLFWVGAKSKNGFGLFSLKSRLFYAHLLPWLWNRGPIKAGMNLDHRCTRAEGADPIAQRACVEFTHLEEITPRENTLRGDGPTAVNARKTTCPQGHPLVERQGRRRCPTCAAAQRSLRPARGQHVPEPPPTPMEESS